VANLRDAVSTVVSAEIHGLGSSACGKLYAPLTKTINGRTCKQRWDARSKALLAKPPTAWRTCSPTTGRRDGGGVGPRPVRDDRASLPAARRAVEVVLDRQLLDADELKGCAQRTRGWLRRGGLEAADGARPKRRASTPFGG
jgi:hypothetical protein